MTAENTGSPSAELQPALLEHPLRRALHDEVHARPHELLKAPLAASHLALVTGERGAGDDLAHLARLCGRFGLAVPPEGNHAALDFPGFRLRWERHAEFSTWTVLVQAPQPEPFQPPALAALPEDWLAGLPGRKLAALHVAFLVREPSPDRLAALFPGGTITGSRVLGGAGAAFTDFRLQADGCGRILVIDQGMTAGQGGRLLQRLLEIETYRMTALLSLPLARELSPRLSQAERDLAGIIEALSAEPDSDDRQLLERLTKLAAEVERLSSSSSFRFAAGRAYYALVGRRIDELREERIPGIQTVGEFMERRLAPAIATCDATARRIEDLSSRIARAGDLLRTRVDIALEEKNRDLLAAMNKRAQLQLRLQQTVEGLSVAAISYYLVGLLGYAAKGAKAAGMPVDPDLAMGLGVPLAVLLVWMGLKRFKKSLHAAD
jgi:uncharacterized membrane-anchored protein